MIREENTENFIVIIITSQKEKRISYYNRTNNPKASKCLVNVSKDDFDYLDRDKKSAINCNEAEYLNISEIVHRVDETKGFKVEQKTLPAYLRKEIVSAINRSPLVPPLIKRLSKEANPL